MSNKQVTINEIITIEPLIGDILTEAKNIKKPHGMIILIISKNNILLLGGKHQKKN